MTLQDTTRDPLDFAPAGAAWIDRSAAGRVEVRGADRLSWLQGLLTNDVAALAPGHGCYAAYLTPQGRMIADVRVLVREEAAWLDLPAGVKDAVLARLDMFVISEDVTLRDLTGEVARLTVVGPQAAAIVARALVTEGVHREACARALAQLAPHAHLARPWHGADALVAGTPELGRPGVDVYVPVALRHALEAELRATGAVALDEPAWHLLRVEAGRPQFGLDMDEDTIPLEAGLEDEAISFTKGCYVGQEIIVRMRDRGHGRVAKRLMRLVAAEADAGPTAAFAAGFALVAGDREVGRVTSAVWSPRRGRTIGLGYVQRAHAEPGVALAARAGDTSVAVVLAPRVAGGDEVSAAQAEPRA